jgi:outer membrane biosynthesis protein TonB
MCQELKEAINRGEVKFGDTGRIVNCSTGMDVPLMTGRGGMKVLFPTPAPKTTAVSTSAIPLNQPTASLGASTTVHLVTINPDGTEYHEIIDAEANEKRRRNDIGKGTKLPETNPHSTESELPHRQPNTQAQPTPSGTQPAPGAQQQTADVPMREAQPREKKYRLGSELRESITIEQIGEKIMNTSISLSFGEILAASPDLAAHFSEQARKRRRPIENTSASPPGNTTNTTNTTSTANANSISSTQVNVNSIISKPLYACASGRAKVLLEDSLKVDALCDDGSEINLMPRRTFERLNIPIDWRIDWRIDGFAEAEKLAEANSNQLLGVLHGVEVNVGGVNVRVPIFVVENMTADLILGRTWARHVRAHFINEDDGSYTCIIKSPDGRRIVRFTAAPAQHERNCAFARHSEEGMVGTEWGKV